MSSHQIFSQPHDNLCWNYWHYGNFLFSQHQLSLNAHSKLTSHLQSSCGFSSSEWCRLHVYTLSKEINVIMLLKQNSMWTIFLISSFLHTSICFHFIGSWFILAKQLSVKSLLIPSFCRPKVSIRDTKRRNK